MTNPKLWDSTLKTLGPNSVPFGHNIANIGTSTVHFKKIIHAGPKYLKNWDITKKTLGQNPLFLGHKKISLGHAFSFSHNFSQFWP